MYSNIGLSFRWTLPLNIVKKKIYETFESVPYFRKIIIFLLEVAVLSLKLNFSIKFNLLYFLHESQPAEFQLAMKLAAENESRLGKDPGKN